MIRMNWHTMSPSSCRRVFWVWVSFFFFTSAFSQSPPEAFILDACSCRLSATGEEGNATAPQNGQFEETIRITSNENEAWMIVENTGFFGPDSPQPPQLPLNLNLPLALPEVAPGIYEQIGIHTDGQGYALTLTNGEDTLYLANMCTNPMIEFDQLATAYCMEDVEIPLSAATDSAEGTVLFNLYASDNQTLLQSDLFFFNPLQLGPGTYWLELVFDQTPDVSPCTDCQPGCIQSIRQSFVVSQEDGAMTCNESIQVALDQDCEEIIHADLLLEGSPGADALYEIHLFEGTLDIGNAVGPDQIDETLGFEVFNTCTGDLCWGSLTVVDQLAPVVLCAADTLEMNCLVPQDEIPLPEVIENCDNDLMPVLIQEQSEFFDCEIAGHLQERMVQSWGAVDLSGNEATPCHMVIEIVRPELTDVQFPGHVEAYSCENPKTHPDITGYPTVDGWELQPGPSNCNLEVNYSDVSFPDCGSSFKLLRTWTIIDDCLPSLAGINPLSQVQIIDILDQDPPLIDCPDTLYFYTTGTECEAEVNLPALTAIDNCGSVYFQMWTPNGFFSTNGGAVGAFPIGEHIVTYKALDDCGNSSLCEVVVWVRDGNPPVAICDELTVVSLDIGGLTEVEAMELDDGSYDDCTEITFEARRMNGFFEFAPTITFSCIDVFASPIPVQLRVTDADGNQNTCMVQVNVQDKLAPNLDCPPDIVLQCDEDYQDLSLSGNVAVEDPCLFSLVFDDVTDLNSCGVGTVVRTFTATDPSGNQSSCSQSITLEDETPFTEADIEWPFDFEASQCDSLLQLSPDSLPYSPVNYAFPEFLDNNCSLIGVNYEDQVFDVAEPACYKIVRTWRVIDWCVFDPQNDPGLGIWEHEQIIKVIDNSPPVVTCPFSRFVKILDPFCYDTVSIPLPQVVDCSPDLSFEISSELGEGVGPFPDVEVGEYDIHFSVSDHCGNTTECSYLLKIVDAKSPTPVCVDDLVVEIEPNGEATVDAAFFNAGSYDNCTADEDLLITYSFHPFDTTLWLNCQDVGIVPVQIWVTDEGGNQAFCQVDIYVQDNTGFCSLIEGASVAGAINTYTNEPLPMVEVEINGAAEAAVVTDSEGAFRFDSIPLGGDYTLAPFSALNPSEGVSTYDLALITRHILNIELLDTPYKIIAADANLSGTVTTSDIVLLQKLILQLETTFPHGQSWRFVDAAYQFPDPFMPFSPSFPEVININDLEEAVEYADFIGIKIGDVNGSATGGNAIEDVTE
jgi:hypothetical protein